MSSFQQQYRIPARDYLCFATVTHFKLEATMENWARSRCARLPVRAVRSNREEGSLWWIKPIVYSFQPRRGSRRPSGSERKDLTPSAGSSFALPMADPLPGPQGWGKRTSHAPWICMARILGGESLRPGLGTLASVLFFCPRSKPSQSFGLSLNC